MLLFLMLGFGAGSALAQNMLNDPGFEQGGADWSASFLRGATGGVVTDAGGAHSGNNYFSTTGVGVWASVGQGDSFGPYPTGTTNSFPITATDFYQLRAWVKVPGANTNPQPITLRYRFEPSGNRNDVGTQTISTTNWTQLISPWIQPAALPGGTGDNLQSYYEVHAVNNDVTMYVDDCEMIHAAPYTISGQVVSNSIGVDGVAVSGSSGAATASATTAGGGFYTLTIPPVNGTWTLSANIPGYLGSTSAVVSSSSTTAPNIVLGTDPNYDPDLIFAARSSAIPSAGAAWPALEPPGSTLATMGSPQVVTNGGQQWETNSHASADGYRFGTYSSSIPVTGASIIAVVRPVRNGITDGWNSVVDVFYNRLVLGVRNDNGNIQVWRNGDVQTGPAIPDGAKTILSLVVQADGSYLVYTNGDVAMSQPAGFGGMTSLDPNIPGPYANAINVGRNNPDGWTAFNGDIGDVYLYQTALSGAKRGALEVALGSKFGITVTSPPSYATVSGTVTDGGSPVVGAVVTATQTAHPLVSSVSAPTDGSGNYSLDCVVGQEYRLSASALPAGRVVTNAPAPFTPADTNAITGKNILVGPDPTYDPDLLFSVRSSDYAGSSSWPTAFPSGGNLVKIAGSPGTTVVNGQNWELNHRATSDGFQFPGAGAGGQWDSAIAVNGATIVAAVRPVRYSTSDGWNSVVDIMYNRLCLCVRNDNGNVQVWRNGNLQTGPSIPNGQITVLSLVVQPDGSYKVYANGSQVMDIGADSSGMYSLDPNWNGGLGYWSYINIGRNQPDGWPVFNGNIGDVYVYKKALADTARTNLEASLTAKYGSAPVFTITATGGTGGSITPSGTVEVPLSADQTFNISTAYGYSQNDVVVDSVSQGVIPSYTFTNVTNNHTISVGWSPLPWISGTVSNSSGAPIYGALVTLSTNSDGSSPIQIRATDASGNYFIAPTVPTGDYYLVARKGGYVTSSPMHVTMSGSSVTGQNFVLTTTGTLDPIVVLDAATLAPGTLTNWPNTGTLGGAFSSLDGTHAPNVNSTYGVQAVEFYQPDSSDASRQTMVASVPTPPEITGKSDWTISAKVYQNSINNGSENTFFSWAGTHGTGTKASFDYAGYNYWAYNHQDINSGFASVPSVGVWHTVTFTYDGTTEKIYVDGVLDSSQIHALNIYAGGILLLGSGTDNDTRLNDNFWRFNGAIEKLEVFDQALTADQVASLVGAATYKWAGPNNGDWSNPANWNSLVPDTSHIAVFSDSASAGGTVQLDTAASVKGLEFNNQVPNTTIASALGNTLTLDDGTFMYNARAPILVDGGAHTISAAVDALAGIELTGPGKLTLSGSASIGTYSAVNPALVVKDGGELELAGSSALTFTRSARVQGGAKLTITGAFTSQDADQIIGTVSGTADVVLSGTGSWTHTGSGVFQIGNDSPGVVGTVTVNDNATLDTSENGPITLSVGWNNGGSGAIIQNGGVVKTISTATPWRNNYGPGMVLGNWNNSPGDATYSLNGGTLEVPNIGSIAWQGDYTTGGVTNPAIYGETAVFNMNGGVLKSSDSDSTDPDAIGEGTAHLIFNTTHTWVQAGGAKIDVAGHNNSIAVVLEHDAALGSTLDGGLMVMDSVGGGTLTLLKACTYTGPLTITNASVNLAYTGNQNVSGLTVNGVSQAPGVYGASATNPGGVFSGTGTVTVVVPLPPTPVLPLSAFTQPGGVPTFSFNTVSGYKYQVVYKNNLTDPTWTPVPPGLITSTGAPMVVQDTTAAGQPHRFYRIEAVNP